MLQIGKSEQHAVPSASSRLLSTDIPAIQLGAEKLRKCCLQHFPILCFLKCVELRALIRISSKYQAPQKGARSLGGDYDSYEESWASAQSLYHVFPDLGRSAVWALRP